MGDGPMVHGNKNYDKTAFMNSQSEYTRELDSTGGIT